MGKVLSLAEQAPPIRIPKVFGDQRKDIERLAARLHGFGLGRSITTDNLLQMSPSQVRSLIDNARKVGFLDEGPGWAMKTTAAKCIGQDLGRMVEQQRGLR